MWKREITIEVSNGMLTLVCKLARKNDVISSVQKHYCTLGLELGLA